MSKLCKRLWYNWFYSTEVGEEFQYREVGLSGVVAINYHEPKGEGDKHFCDVLYDSGVKERVFNLNKVEFLQEQDIKLNSLDYLGIPD